MTRIGTRIGTRKATRIGLTYDAPLDEERALTAHALEAIGDVLFLEANDSLPTQLQQQRPDIVVNLARGSDAPARRVHIPAFLEYFDIPYLGSDAVTHATCVERPRMKQALAYHGIRSTGFTVVESLSQLAPFAQRTFPVAIRRARGVSSCFALLLAHDFDELESIASELLTASSEAILVEPFLVGESFACTILGNGDDVVSLPIVRVANDDLEPPASRRHECPARISHGLAEDIESIAIRAFFALNCRDVARVDIRLDDRGVPNVCAVDPLPSFAPGSAGGVVLPASRAAGLDDDEMVQRCLLLAADRVGLDVPKAPVFSPLRRRTPPGGTRLR